LRQHTLTITWYNIAIINAEKIICTASTKTKGKMENGWNREWDRHCSLDQGELVCVTVYKKGAQEVKRRIEELKSMVEEANKFSQNEEAAPTKIQ
jgi:hypothetical protein